MLEVDCKKYNSSIIKLMIKKFHIEAISIVILVMWLSRFIQDKNAVIPIVVLVGVCILFVIEIRFRHYILKISKAEMNSKLMEAELLKTEEMVDNLRAQKHEFANNLQMISGLAQLGRIDSLLDYISQIKGNMNLKNVSFKLDDHPEFGVIVNNKFNIAKEKGIEATIKMEADLDRLEISPFKLTTIISNLLDNAIRALQESGLRDQKLKLSITRSDGYIVFGVWDNFGPIPEEIVKKLFVKGFTTKNEDGHGIGLFLVKNLVEEMNGSIEVDTSEEGTLFTVKFPEARQFELAPVIEHEVVRMSERLSMESENVY